MNLKGQLQSCIAHEGFYKQQLKDIRRQLKGNSRDIKELKNAIYKEEKDKQNQF